MHAVMTLAPNSMAPELKTIADFTAFLLSRFTAVGAELSIWTDRFFAASHNRGIVYIRRFMTHAEYSKEDWKNDP